MASPLTTTDKTSYLLLCDNFAGDTERLSRQLYQYAFKRIITVNTPQRIMPLLARDAFDVLFLTIAASSLEDAEHIRLIRERFCEAGLPILLITEPAAAQVRNLALTYGANDCLNKP